MLFGNEVWSLRQNEFDIQERTERAMVRGICRMNLSDRLKIKFLIDKLGLKEILETLAKASGVRWFGHVMRRNEGDVLRKELAFEIDSLKKKGRQKVKWKNKIVSEISKVGLKENNALDRKKWRLDICIIAKNVL